MSRRAIILSVFVLSVSACASSSSRRPVPDSGFGDTSTTDTGVGDTASPDTRVTDTSTTDTRVTDTSTTDTGTTDGAMCASGLTRCGTTCVDTTADATHCGMCDMACASGESCTDGVCCMTGLAVCAGTCTDTATDDANCGACGTTCPSGESCAMGTCRSGFTGMTGTTWQSVGTISRGLQHWVPTGETYMYAGSGGTFVRHEMATMLTSPLVAAPSGLAGWGSPTLVGGNLWEIVPPNILRYDIMADSWTTVRSDVPGTSTDSMTVFDGAGNLWAYRSGDALVRYTIATNTISEFTTGVVASTQTRLGYDPGTNSLYFGSALSTSSFHRFDIATSVVSTLAPHPEGTLSDTFCTDLSGHIYAAGACGGPTMYMYDIATNAWSLIPDLPTSGCNGSCSVHEDGWLYVEDLGTAHRIELY